MIIFKTFDTIKIAENKLAHLGLDGSDCVAHRYRVRPTLLQEANVQLQLRILK